MDTNTLIVELIKTLLWPVTILMVIVLLRPSLLELVPALRRIRSRDFEVEFEQKLEQLAGQADQAQLPPAKDVKVLVQAAAGEGASLVDLVEPVALQSPRVAVAEAWRLLNATLGQDRGEIPLAIAAIVAELKALRSRVVHDSLEITPGLALQYAIPRAAHRRSGGGC